MKFWSISIPELDYIFIPVLLKVIPIWDGDCFSVTVTRVHLFLWPQWNDYRSGKSQWRECRGCFFCIARCEDCGGCFDFSELSEETICSHLLCQTCWLRLPKCNICNRPYCNRHSNILEGSSKFLGFLCGQCMESTSSSYQSYSGKLLILPHCFSWFTVDCINIGIGLCWNVL